MVRRNTAIFSIVALVGVALGVLWQQTDPQRLGVQGDLVEGRVDSASLVDKGMEFGMMTSKHPVPMEEKKIIAKENDVQWLGKTWVRFDLNQEKDEDKAKAKEGGGMFINYGVVDSKCVGDSQQQYANATGDRDGRGLDGPESWFRPGPCIRLDIPDYSVDKLLDEHQWILGYTTGAHGEEPGKLVAFYGNKMSKSIERSLTAKYALLPSPAHSDSTWILWREKKDNKEELWVVESDYKMMLQYVDDIRDNDVDDIRDNGGLSALPANLADDAQNAMGEGERSLVTLATEGEENE